MLAYTICFIKKGDEILMLNREKSSWMGMWNGVGGKIEKNETPHDCILREIKEETGIQVSKVDYKGQVTWHDGKIYLGGMHTYMVELPETYDSKAPIKTDEGILDWKKESWILDEENLGVVGNIKYFLPIMLNDSNVYDHQFVYEGMKIVDYRAETLKEQVLSNY
ncbi:NUDIX domain-containing protein [Virgibacillus byunsanensis]|uniref:NUDIX domain-containing protein n=1 Tax=Virgibacillus byunsanensis TaxID=570945 RepID=A0ABW3LRD9_9BACI